MNKIKDLTAAQLGRHAETVHLFAGVHVTGLRLTFHALSKDPDEPRALRALSDNLNGDLQKESGWEQLCAAVLEHALRPGSPLSPDERAKTERHLFLSKWSWAFVKKRDGEATASMEELEDGSLFIFDEAGYKDFVAGAVERCGSLEAVFRTAWTTAGMLGGLLLHKTRGKEIDDEDTLHPDEFLSSAEYAPWLESCTDELDAMEVKRQSLPAA